MVGFEEPLKRERKVCEICGRAIEGGDPTDFMVKYGIHMRGHRVSGLRPEPPDGSVDKFN